MARRIQERQCTFGHVCWINARVSIPPLMEKETGLLIFQARWTLSQAQKVEFKLLMKTTMILASTGAFQLPQSGFIQIMT